MQPASIRVAPRERTARRSLFSALRTCVWLAAAALPVLGALAGTSARAQRSSDFGMVYVQERSNFISPGAAGSHYFYLRGASVDYGMSLWKGIGVTGSATGIAVSNLNSNVDIQHIEFLGGVRYTYNLGHITPTTWGRHGGIFAEGKAGYTFAIAGQYPQNGTIQSSAAALTYAGGGGINVHIYQRFDLRLIEVHYVRTQLPNGTNNQQDDIRAAAGINFHFGN